MRKLQLAVLLISVAALTYATMPFLAAWQLREAVRAGDLPTLRERVDWPSVRQSLKSSIGEVREALQELAEVAGEPPQGLWQRIKSAAFPYVADPLIERYVTPEGVARLYVWRQAWRRRVAGGKSSAGVGDESRSWLGANALSRGVTALGRIERVSFTTPMRVEIGWSDTLRPGRSWLATLRLGATGWRLTEVRILRQRPSTRARSARATPREWAKPHRLVPAVTAPASPGAADQRKG